MLDLFGTSVLKKKAREANNTARRHRPMRGAGTPLGESELTD